MARCDRRPQLDQPPPAEFGAFCAAAQAPAALKARAAWPASAVQPPPPPAPAGGLDPASDEWHMLFCKVLPCPERRPHVWRECRYAHGGDRTRRRCPRAFQYAGEM